MGSILLGITLASIDGLVTSDFSQGRFGFYRSAAANTVCKRSAILFPAADCHKHDEPGSEVDATQRSWSQFIHMMLGGIELLSLPFLLLAWVDGRGRVD